MKYEVGLIHTSPAAIPPLAQFFGGEAPELALTHQLDSGLLGLLAREAHDVVETRLAEMMTAARRVYNAELLLLTCSSVPQSTVDRLQSRFDVPLVKIDQPMARQAVELGRRIGVVASFAATCTPTERLLREMAARADREVEVTTRLVTAAYDALLAGDIERHDALLVEAVDALTAEGADVVVLAQVSMARLAAKLDGQTRVPVLSSPPACLAAMRSHLRIGV